MNATPAAAVVIELLADRADLIVSLAGIRWTEWGGEPGREDLRWWIDTARHECGLVALPVAFVAVDAAGQAVGGIRLDWFDLPERADRGPWVVGTIVRADRRDRGIGTLLMAAVRRWAVAAGIDALWVATGGRAIAFYRRCGFTVIETFTRANGEHTTILSTWLHDPPSTEPAAAWRGYGGLCSFIRTWLRTSTCTPTSAAMSTMRKASCRSWWRASGRFGHDSATEGQQVAKERPRPADPTAIDRTAAAAVGEPN